ncbi:hypothetical protein KQH82_09065 [bacterium]|nr:hypothetical protein [bacterium]
MKKLVILFLVSCVVASGSVLADVRSEGDIDYYLAHYPYVEFRGKVYTVESEFTIPAGYSRIDSSALSPYQYWVSYLPLWHSQRPAAKINGVMFEADSISRSVHLPWRTSRFFDYAIPVQLLVEYGVASGHLKSFEWWPIEGDTVTWDRFLNNKAVTNRGRSMKFLPAEKRDSTSREIDAFVDLCARWTDYQTLADNCVELDDDEPPMPGDLFIARDSSRQSGVVYVVLTAIVNGDGDYLYTVGTGCPDKCDFHIPLFGDSRERPWVGRERIEQLGAGRPFSGFYRPRVWRER